MTKEQIKSAPDYDRDTWNDEARTQYSDYYSNSHADLEVQVRQDRES